MSANIRDQAVNESQPDMDDEKVMQNVDMVELSEEDIAMEKRIVRKIDIRLLPTTALIYLLCYLDRSNIGNARILNSSTNDSMMQTTNMTPYQFTIALMVFLVAYSIFEAPSNLALKAFQPHRWLGFLVLAFGAFCAAIGGVNTFGAVTALRFFLGAAEAGVFPGMIFYFSFWYKQSERATRIAVFLTSATLAGAFGGAIAFAVGHMNGAGGLEGWRWLFIIEGIPSIVLGIFVFFWLPSYPEKANWLSESEKELQIRRLGVHRSSGEDKINRKDLIECLKDYKLYAHYFMYSCIGCIIASLSLFAPVIVAGLGYRDLQAQLFTVPPYAAAYFVTMFLAWLSDKYQTRGLIAVGSLTVSGIAFLVQAALPGTSFTLRYVMLCIGVSGAFGSLPSVNAWVGDNVKTTTARSISIALNIAFSGPGQIVGVWIYRAQDAPFYSLGHGFNAGASFVAAIIALGLTIHYRRLNARQVGTNEMRWMA